MTQISGSRLGIEPPPQGERGSGFDHAQMTYSTLSPGVRSMATPGGYVHAQTRPRSPGSAGSGVREIHTVAPHFPYVLNCGQAFVPFATNGDFPCRRCCGDHPRGVTPLTHIPWRNL